MKIKISEIKSENIQDAIREIQIAYPGIGFETAEIAATHIITLDENWTDEPNQPETQPIDWDDFENWLRGMAAGSSDKNSSSNEESDYKYFNSLADECSNQVMLPELATWYDNGNYSGENSPVDSEPDQPETPKKSEPKTEFDFGAAAAEWYKQNEPTWAVYQDDLTRNIPSDDYSDMRRAGIKNPDPRRYWEGFNSEIEDDEELESIRANDLDELLSMIKSGELDSDSHDWSSFPTFGGDEPYNTYKVWSWDETRLLTGTCADDMKIIDRPKTLDVIVDDFFTRIDGKISRDNINTAVSSYLTRFSIIIENLSNEDIGAMFDDIYLPNETIDPRD